MSEFCIFPENMLATSGSAFVKTQVSNVVEISSTFLSIKVFTV